MARRIGAMLGLAAMAAAAAPAQAAPLQPTGPWNVNYTATSCDAKRRFGDVLLSISPAPLGATVRLVVELRGAATRARQYPAVFDAADGRGAELFTALIFPAAAKGRRGVYAVLPKASFARMLESGRLNFRAGTADRNNTIVATIAGVDLDLGKSGGLITALDKCLADLQRHWGMEGGKVSNVAVEPRPRGDQKPIFQSGDYPVDAMRAGHTGGTVYLLLIGTDGSVIDCVIQQSSGVASLDAMGCQGMRERAKFEPARDATGKPVFGTYKMSLRWQIQ